MEKNTPPNTPPKKSTHGIKSINEESSVLDRYSKAAEKVEPALCCPVDYNRKYLEVIPKEVIDKDYGCGDPSKYVKEGETVLDLGSGGGKICFIASQVVGPKGRVIGVDMNDVMLNMARRASKEVGKKIGFENVEFRKGRIQDLKQDYERLDAYLAEHPVNNLAGLKAMEDWKERFQAESPLVSDNSIDVVVSNCVLNLVKPSDKGQLFQELFRVLRKGGRAVISDIVSDEEIPLHLQKDPELWSGCISGAYQELAFLKAFENAGFYGIKIVERQKEAWQTVEGIEFRSVTVEAYKGKEGECLEHFDAAIYKGPFKTVSDDDGHTYKRGETTAVCRKTAKLLSAGPYQNHFEVIAPFIEVPESEAKSFLCTGYRNRAPKETKGQDYKATLPTKGLEGSSCC